MGGVFEEKLMPLLTSWCSFSAVRNTYLAPQTGTPAITVPMGFSGSGYPAGLMISARHFDEATLFEVVIFPGRTASAL